MKPFQLDQITVKGDLARRILKNYARCEGECYRPETVFDADQNNWPGDWEGRIILALVLLAQATGREPAYLGEILRLLPEHMNEKGYLGPIYPDEILDEQQLSGHSWLLRGLCELYEWRLDPSVRSWIDRIVTELYLPARGRFLGYPVDPASRIRAGGAAGSQTGECLDGWQVSTDIGCAYISFDGLSHYYQISRLPEVKELLKEMADTFLRIDFTGLSMQTHATLSGTRGLLRFAKCISDTQLCREAERIFTLYCREGMTENFANQNWFRRPEWTEPCAVVDSFWLAQEFSALTGKAVYQELAQKIYYNALCRAQRDNGGFGCDNCLSQHEKTLYGKIYEAYWCCTMRGAEGLSRAAQYLAGTEDGALVIQGYGNYQFSFEGGVGEMRSNYPYSGGITLWLSLREDTRCRFFIPSFVQKVMVGQTPYYLSEESEWLELILPAGDSQTELHFDIPFYTEQTGDYEKYWHGILLLGNRTDEARIDSKRLFLLGGGVYEDREMGFRLEPVALDEEKMTHEWIEKPVRVLFHKKWR